MKYVIKNKNYHILIVLIFSAIIYFMGNMYLSISDPVESNYALTAKEMLLNHNYLSPQIFGHYWYDKPIFYYWELIIGMINPYFTIGNSLLLSNYLVFQTLELDFFPVY